MGKHKLPMSQEEREKRSLALKGKKKSPETITKMKEAQKNVDHSHLQSTENRIKAGKAISKALTGKKRGPMSEENKDKIRQAAIGRERTPEHNKKLGLARTGEKSHFWKGGIAVKNAEDRKQAMTTSEYKVWRRTVLDKDNNKCVKHGLECKGPLHVHHIKSWRDFPTLRFEISNGETLCQKHHYETDNFAGRIFKLKSLAKENF